MKLKMMALAVMAAFSAPFRLGAVAVTVTKEEHAKLPKDVQALYVAKGDGFALDGIEIEDTKGLKTALEKEREAARTSAKALKELQAQWEGLDPKQIKDMLEKMGSDTEAQLIKAGKIDEVVAMRTAKANEAHARALKKAEEAIAAANARADKFAGQVLDNHVRAAATKAGLHANAVEDALFRARTIFKLDAEGNAVQLDAEGKPVMGKDTKSPFSPAEWLDGMRETAPHWFPSNNSGSGASSNKGSKGATIKRADFDKLDPVTRAAKAKEAGKGELTIVD